MEKGGIDNRKLNFGLKLKIYVLKQANPLNHPLTGGLEGKIYLINFPLACPVTERNPAKLDKGVPLCGIKVGVGLLK